jgi:probable HAF family extracellular repeat protein
MFRRTTLFLTFLALFLIHTVTPVCAQIYTITDLQALVNPGTSFGFGVNVNGVVTGESSTVDQMFDNGAHAFRWLPSTNKMHDLGSLGQNSIGSSINSIGDVVGV